MANSARAKLDMAGIFSKVHRMGNKWLPRVYLRRGYVAWGYQVS
jgi:cell division protein FtsN